MQWLSINDVKRLVKQKMYQFETGSKPGDQLIYDKNSGKYVGHVENGNFYQDKSYQIPQYIIQTLKDFDNDWTKDGSGW